MWCAWVEVRELDVGAGVWGQRLTDVLLLSRVCVCLCVCARGDLHLPLPFCLRVRLHVCM